MREHEDREADGLSEHAPREDLLSAVNVGKPRQPQKSQHISDEVRGPEAAYLPIRSAHQVKLLLPVVKRVN